MKSSLMAFSFLDVLALLFLNSKFEVIQQCIVAPYGQYNPRIASMLLFLQVVVRVGAVFSANSFLLAAATVSVLLELLLFIDHKQTCFPIIQFVCMCFSIYLFLQCSMYMNEY